MAPIPEVESLREKVATQHIQHVITEINLAVTFLELARVEFDSGETEAGVKSYGHAEQALAGARKGLGNIALAERRALLGDRISEVERALREFVVSSRPQTPANGTANG